MEGIQALGGGAEETSGTLRKGPDSRSCTPVLRAQMPGAGQVVHGLIPAELGQLWAAR